MKNTVKSQELFANSLKHIPGGVNSPARAFQAVGGNPLFIQSGKGSYITDADHNEYIDYVCSWGPLILGHAFPSVVHAIQQQATKGTSYGAPTAMELSMARLITEAFPSMDQVRLVNSGTEAVMSALRLARAYTGRSKIIKFEGCYHGHSDSLLIKAGSAALTLGVPSSPGVPAALAELTLNVSFNDFEQIKRIFEEQGPDIAAVIVEPVPGNMGVVPPLPGFLNLLRELTELNESLLIFDEVITGFRVAYGGAQTLFNIQPDLTCLGKIIGGGLPVGAYGGKRSIMAHMAPLGPVFQAGTLSGNPLAMAAGIATLEALKTPGTYEQLEARSKRLEEGLLDSALKAEVSIVIHRLGSMLCPFFTDQQVLDHATATAANSNCYAKFFRALLQEGIYFPPSPFESLFVSLAHSEADIERTIQASGSAFKRSIS